MLIESLARLTLVQEECKEKGITIVSSAFMKDTQDVIDSQIKLLQRDMAFQDASPGPYVYGIGKYSISIFPPLFTESADWVMIVLNEETQNKERLFVFHSLLSLLENLGNAFKYIESKNACTTEQDRESQTEAGSLSTDTPSDSHTEHIE
jgi:hypothetical protein